MNNSNQLINPFDNNYFIGYVSYVSPNFSKIHFPSSVLLKQFNFAGEEMNAGLIGNYVAIEGDNYGFLGKIIEIALPEKERLELNEKSFKSSEFHPTGKVEILLAFNFLTRKIKRGLGQFPSVGAKVYICSSSVISSFFEEYGRKSESDQIYFDLATLSFDQKTNIRVSPQSLFGRHCAIVGTTGGGKSYTLAKLLEETIKHKGKAILIDATGEFENVSLGNSADADNLTFNLDTFFHYSYLKTTDLFVLFRPSEQIQLPKLQEAIKTLKLIHIISKKDGALRTAEETTFLSYANPTYGFLDKSGKQRNIFISVIKSNPESEYLDGNFDINILAYQIHYECVWNTDQNKPDHYGGINERDLGMCQSLITRIFFITKTNYFKNIFGLDQNKDDPNEFTFRLNQFLQSEKNLFRISLSDVPFESNVREILVNSIGNVLLDRARKKQFISDGNQPVLVFIDEAHQFLNKRIKGEFSFDVELGAFDQIAKECRKYGLFLILATQMPRDIPHGTLSQVGTFIVHRLINHLDKEAIENACSASNQYSLSFLPSLGEGEALLMGVDFPMPVILKMDMPRIEPKYNTPTIFKIKSPSPTI